MPLFVKDKKFYQSFISLTLIITLQNLVTHSVNLADNVMLGRYSEISLSGVALVNQIQFILNMLTMGVGEAIVVISSQYWGKKDTGAVKRILSCALRVGVVAALTFMAIVFFFPTWCLSLFTNELPVIEEGAKYLQIICFTYIFFTMTNILLAGLRSVETVRVGFIVSLSTLFINVILNYILIYGNFGAPRLGIQGAAIATLISRVVELFIVIIYLKKFDKKLLIKLSDLKKLDMSLFRDYMRVGLPVIISNTMWGIAMAVQASVLGHLGGATIAANSISATVFQILTVLCYGGASATCIITGRTIGEGNIDKLKTYTKTFQIIFIAIGIATGLGLFAIRDVILSFYTVSQEAQELARSFINVLCITVVGTSYQVACCTGIVRGGGDTKFVLYNDAAFMWLLVIPLSLLAAYVFKLPPVAVFFCLKCDQLLKCIVAAIKVNRHTWIKKLTR